MTYKLNPELRKIQSPVVLVLPDGSETDYPDGIALTEITFTTRYVVQRMLAKGNKVVISLEKGPDMPDNSKAWATGNEDISFF